MPALFHPRIRTFTCGATDIYLRCYRLHGGCAFEYTSGGSCGRACNVPPIDWDIYLRCKNISYRARYRPLAKSERKGKGAKVTPRPQRNTEQTKTDRRARCGGTIDVGAMYGDCKRKRVGKDFSAFVHTKTAKPFGNYRDCIGLCDMVETLEVEEQKETAKVREVLRDCKSGKR